MSELLLSACGAPVTAVPFVGNLREHAERVAVIAPDGAELTYRELADRVDETAARIGTERMLVLVEAGTGIEPLVTYLAALRGGHPVLMAAAGDPHRLAELVAAYDPDVVAAGAGGDWRLRHRRERTAHALHPDLALLLSTSGSSGSPKLVRLSAANVAANAASIAQYLDIRETDRAVAALPLHYCYGLSIVNSNLLRGAALIMTPHSVTDPRFWTAVREHRATSLHGVPHTFDLLDRIGFADLDLPDLRYVTQAGGRLAPEKVRRFAELGERRGWRLFVMYGQTEATARMSYLPPELATTRPATIGVPIPGGSFRLDGGSHPDEGELVYSGPNVMMGYADGPADLALGAGVGSLATGDLARRGPDGLYEIIGRKSRFVKIFGLRLDLDRVEQVLLDAGIVAACTGDDDGLLVVVTGDHGLDDVSALVARRCGLPPNRVRACAVFELPRLASGKIDYAGLGRHRPPEQSSPPGIAADGSVRALFAQMLRRPDIDDDATFVTLGGDSLTYVEMSIALEERLGGLPADWHTRPVRDLEQLRRPRRPRRLRTVRMETSILLRAASIVLVVASHVGAVYILGGAHLLLVLSGWSFARFGLARVAAASIPKRICGSLVRIAVPTVLWIGWRAASQPDIELHNALLVNSVLDPATWGYWFVEALVQALLVLAVLFSIPAVRRAERARPFGVAAAVLAAAVLLREIPFPANEFADRFMSFHLVLWLFVLGWLAHRAVTGTQRLTVLGLVWLLVPGFFGDPARDTVVAAGLVVLLLVPAVTVPRLLTRPVGLLAGASLYIYLTHYAVYPMLSQLVPVPLVVVLTLAVGILAWLAVERCGRLVVGRAPVLRPAGAWRPVAS